MKFPHFFFMGTINICEHYSLSDRHFDIEVEEITWIKRGTSSDDWIRKKEKKVIEIVACGNCGMLKLDDF